MVVNTLYCHVCDINVRIRVEETETGNVTVPCPNCNHNHYRYVMRGIITGERWKGSGATVRWAFTSSTSTFSETATGTADAFLSDSWNNTDSASW